MTSIRPDAPLAVVFPGQGTQRVGMGRFLFRPDDDTRRLLDAANDAVGADVTALMRRGPAAELARTEYAQVAIFVTNLVGWRRLRDAGVEPVAMAGHSVGEIAALCAAGGMDEEDGLALVARRGSLMASVREQGAMAAVLGLDVAAVERLCEEASPSGRLGIGLVNGPSNVVLSGPVAEVETASAVAARRGAVRVARLATSNAFHSSFMASIAPEWRAIVDRAPIRDAAVPIALNVDGCFSRDQARIRAALVDQMTSRVQWLACMEAISAVAETIVECGDSRTLSGLARAAAPRTRAISLGDPTALRSLIRTSALPRVAVP